LHCGLPRGSIRRATNRPFKTGGAHDHATDAQGAWTITFLLFLFMLVNFADKIVVGLAGAPIMAS
jgi:hypothetical protein